MRLIETAQPARDPLSKLLSLLDQLDELVLVADERGRVRHMSRAARQQLWNAEGDAGTLARWVADLEGMDEQRIGQALDDYARAPGQGRDAVTVRLRWADGSLLPAGAAVCKTRREGAPVYLWLLRDQSRMRHAEAQLLDAQRLVRSILHNTSEGYVLMDAGGTVLDTNPAFEAMCGRNALDLRDISLFSLFDGAGRAAMLKLIKKLGTGRPASAEVTLCRAGGEKVVGLFKGAPLFDADGEQVGMFGLVTDITEAKARERRIETLAYFDPLTELANRSLLNEQLEQAMLLSRRGGYKLALLFLDLDRFKHVNDSFNHTFGDQLLRQVAERIRTVVRRSDVVARLGGDEFVVGLIEPRRIEDAARVAEKLLAAITEPFVIEEHTLYISGSIGISVFPDDAATVEDMVRNADLAMYQAKEEGRKRYCYFTAALNERVRYQRTLERQMRSALEGNEFRLHYQPKVEAVTGRIVGAEALIRWQSPVLGMVSPADFIPLAEESGMIVPIGAWVLEEAARQIRAWHAECGPVSVAVNVSGLQLFAPDFLPQLEALAAQSAEAARCLQLELTESSLMRDVERVIVLLQRLCALGYTLSIDDFGTGYSSFNYLTRFPIHTLKIDQSFVRDLPHQADAVTVVGAIAGMAKNLGLNIVAEGVESAAQAEHLAGIGCDQLQGYFYSRPVPAEAFAELLRSGPYDRLKVGHIRP